MATKVTNGLDLQNQRVINTGDPSGAQDVATKAYVDAAARGINWKPSVRAASTGNLTIASPGATIDGVSMSAGDRFLAKDQSTGSQNGIYTWNGAASAATRTTDADTSAEVIAGMAVTVTEGTVNGDKVFILTTNNPITLGTTSLAFSALGGSSSYTAGNGLTLTGSDFAVGAGTGISVAADAVSIDTSVVARKFAANVGDGSSTSIAITHSFGTRDVHVEVYTNASPWDTVICDVERTDANNVTLKFATAPASGAYRVVVVG